MRRWEGKLGDRSAGSAEIVEKKTSLPFEMLFGKPVDDDGLEVPPPSHESTHND